MKKLLLLILPIVIFTNCGGNEFEEGFEMNYFQDFEIFAGLNTLETHIIEFTNIPSQSEDFFTGNGVQDYQVKSILPKSFILTNISGNAIDYDVLERVRLNIVMEDGTEETEIAFREPVPLNTGFELDLIPTLADVVDHLKGERYTLKLKLNFREVPQQSINTRINFRFQALTDE